MNDGCHYWRKPAHTWSLLKRQCDLAGQQGEWVSSLPLLWTLHETSEIVMNYLILHLPECKIKMTAFSGGFVTSQKTRRIESFEKEVGRVSSAYSVPQTLDQAMK